MRIGQVEFGAKVFKFLEDTTLPSGRLLPTQGQLQDLGGILGPSLQGCPETIHACGRLGNVLAVVCQKGLKVV